MNKTIKTILWLIVAIIIVGGVWYGVSRKPVLVKEEKIKIGVIAPLTGPLGVQGQWMINGIELAKKDLNKKGGVNGREIELIYEDTKCSPKDTTIALQKLINIDNTVGIIGPICGSPEMVSIDFSRKYERIIISPSSNFGKKSPYFFSTQTLLSEEAELLAKFAKENLKLNKVAILYPNNDFGIIYRNSFKKKFEDLGGEIPITEAITFTQEDFRTELTKIKNKNPEGLFIIYSRMGNIVNQMRELGLNIQVLGQCGTESPSLLKIANESAEGIIYSWRGVSDESHLSKMQKQFNDKYQQAYNETTPMMARDSYDALTILVYALKNSKNFGAEQMKNIILNIKNYQSVTGVLTFDRETYNVEKPIIFKTVKNGQFVPYEE